MARSRKKVSDSRTVLSQIMQPEHANVLGNVHGGWIMKLVDETGALAAIRHAGNRVVTVAIDQMTFKHPIKIGDVIILEAEVSYVGNTSIETEVYVYAENAISGQRWHTNTAYLVYVALDDKGKPIQVPELETENQDQDQRFEDGKLRQAYRLEQTKKREED